MKTWIKTNLGVTGPDAPTLKEYLTFYFYRHPLSFSNQVVGTSNTQGCNVQITLKYVVQFKDLRVEARYPAAAATDFTLTIDPDVVQIPA